MNITFLVGNGFDLNLGLETRYSDFLKDYQNVVTCNRTIDNFKVDIMSDLPFWSNAELAFGQYTEKFDSASEFCSCHKNFCEELAAYLDKQESRLNFDGLANLIPNLFIKSINSYKNGFREEQQQQIKTCFDASQGAIRYNFISFNYTKTLDKCIELSKNNSLLGCVRYYNSVDNNRLGSMLHIHGFTDRDMVLGVNDKSQIANPKLFEGTSEEFIGQIIKKETNRLNEEHMDEKCSTLLNESDLIYVYGMSIGETDAIWWQRICTILKTRPRVRVILHSFDAPKEGIIRTEFIQHERKMREKFVNYSNFSQELKESMMNRIHITAANIFESMNDLVNCEENKLNELVVTV